MRNSTMIRHALLATTLLGAHSIANARPAPTTNPPAAVEAQANQNEIIITAQKRSEKLQNVPIQVDVLTGKTLEARQMKMTNEIARTVPNLTIEKTDVYSGFADVSFGRGSTLETTAAASGPIVADKVLFRVAGTYFHTDGVIPNTFRHINNDHVPYDWSVRGNMLFHLGGSSTLSLI